MTIHQSKKFIALACVFAMFAILLNAFLAHMLKTKLNTYQLAVYQTGVFYQFIHSMALFGVGLSLVHYNHRFINLAGNLFFLGIILFSGSLYAISIFQLQSLTIAAPFGGLAFIFGWLFLAIGISKAKVESKEDETLSE